MLKDNDFWKGIVDMLPHGSGINATWTWDHRIDPIQDGERVYLHNSYHSMNEYGCYCAWFDFSAEYSVHIHENEFEFQFENIWVDYTCCENMDNCGTCIDLELYLEQLMPDMTVTVTNKDEEHESYVFSSREF